ncbi:hypothetical protein BX666DRAFT_387700 [Dichotomocladium elegans]|nr:hypothetical protein BX666DRAFT_387700 [Dichotomocladium elegans]
MYDVIAHLAVRSTDFYFYDSALLHGTFFSCIFHSPLFTIKMPFGGSPSCQRCHKAVYMAEKVIGPGGAYHVMCLTCKECNKRLDSTSLRERDNEAYCKVCYNRKWGPKGYGFASGAAFLSTESKMPKDILAEQEKLQGQMESQVVSPVRAQAPAATTKPSPQLPPRPGTSIKDPEQSPSKHGSTGPTPSPVLNSFWSNRSDSSSAAPPKPPVPANKPAPPPVTATKPAYLNTSYVPRKIALNIQNDTCTKCGKTVYAAEMVLGAGNKYHALCLKCTECGKLLSSNNLVDKDFDLYCRGCYAKLFGPKGFGFGNLLSTEGTTR